MRVVDKNQYIQPYLYDSFFKVGRNLVNLEPTNIKIVKKEDIETFKNLLDKSIKDSNDIITIDTLGLR